MEKFQIYQLPSGFYCLTVPARLNFGYRQTNVCQNFEAAIGIMDEILDKYNDMKVFRA